VARSTSPYLSPADRRGPRVRPVFYLPPPPAPGHGRRPLPHLGRPSTPPSLAPRPPPRARIQSAGAHSSCAASAFPLPPHKAPPPFMAAAGVPAPPPPCRPLLFPRHPIKDPLKLLYSSHRSSSPFPRPQRRRPELTAAVRLAASISFAGALPSLPSPQVKSSWPPLQFGGLPLAFSGRRPCWRRRRAHRRLNSAAAACSPSQRRPFACSKPQPPDLSQRLRSVQAAPVKPSRTSQLGLHRWFF
jgi:hypothetical protein